MLSQDPPGGSKAKPGKTVTIVVGRLCRDPLMPKLRVAVVMGGRSSEHEISLASARSVLEALDPARYEAVTVEIGRDGRWELGSGIARRARAVRALRDGDAAGADVSGSRDAVGGRRRLPRPARAVRRGRHRSGPARAGRRPLRRRGHPRLGALHGQGPVQGGAPRRGDPGHAERDAPSERGRLREPLRLPGVREARAARLLGRDQQGARRGRAPRRDRARLPARREGARRGIRLRGRGRVQRAREPGADRVDSGRDRGELRLVRLLRRSTTRAAWSS